MLVQQGTDATNTMPSSVWRTGTMPASVLCTHELTRLLMRALGKTQVHKNNTFAEKKTIIAIATTLAMLCWC